MLVMHSYIVEQTLLPISVFILHVGLMIKHKKYVSVHVCVCLCRMENVQAKWTKFLEFVE